MFSADERAEFEEEVRKHFDPDRAEEFLARDDAGNYEEWAVMLAWDVWQARAALAQQGRDALPPENCRQRLCADGKPYARSSCAVCGQFSSRWKDCDADLLAAQPVAVPDASKALDAAIDWISKVPHGDNCYLDDSHPSYPGQCHCGKDSILSYLLEVSEGQPAAECTNSDTWNCKYCRNTVGCAALNDPQNFGSPKTAKKGAKAAAQHGRDAERYRWLSDEQIFALFLRSGLGKYHVPRQDFRVEFDKLIAEFARAAIDAAIGSDAGDHCA